MKKIFKFLLYLILFLLFLTALTFAGYWMIVVLEWQWWIFAVTVGGLTGVVLGILAIKKFLLRRNEKKFVQRVIMEEDATTTRTPVDEHKRLKGMQAHWYQSIEKLKKSHLRRRGNPLYVLPWFMVMGESRAGKTCAIKNTNLSSPLTDVSDTATISGTENCDWWFFDKAIILDTAGRYSVPLNKSLDNKEFEEFLALLAKYRKKEPINGLIIAVASDVLLNEDEISLSEKAKSIRQRINQLMRILGAKFPVYLLITKMDLVNGFTDFCEHLPDKRETQVMGYSNEEKNPDCMEVLEDCMITIFHQLTNLRTIFIQERINNFAISFPMEFLALKPGLESYVRILFGEDTYQATPFFRGIYFSSACREGLPESDFLEKYDIKCSPNTGKKDKKAYFLKNLFDTVLPGDRNVFTPITEFIMWRKTTIGLGVFSLMIILLALCEVLTLSYYNNIKALNSFNKTVFSQPPRALDITDSLLVLDRQRFEIAKLEQSNGNWVLPRMGLRHSLIVEKNLKQSYIRHVEESLIKPLDRSFFDSIEHINAKTPYQEIVNYAIYAVRRIMVLKNAIEDTIVSDDKEFEKSIETLFPSLISAIPGAIAIKFSDIYYDYLDWNDNETLKTKKLNEFQNQLSKIADKSGGFRWLVSRAVCNASDITIEDFFKGYDINQSRFRFRVGGAFTKAGRDEIHKFTQLIKNAFPGSEAFMHMENEFWAWYKEEFYKNWHNFADTFPKGGQWDAVTQSWLQAGPLMSTGHNPYFLLLYFMADEFNLFIEDSGETPPAWAEMLIRLKKVKKLAETEMKKEEGSLMAKLALKKDKITGKLLGGKGKKIYGEINRLKATDIDYNLVLAKGWITYEEALKTLSSVTSHKEKCYFMFSDFFAMLSDPSKEDKAYNQVLDSLMELETLIKQQDAGSEVFNLIEGPFDYFKAYGTYNTVHFLQDKWDETVLGPSSTIDPEKYYSVMFDKDAGLIWKYINDFTAPFLDRNKTGFFARRAFGISLPFTNQFFRLLDKGEGLSLDKQQEYNVSIQTVPINVNNEAGIKPHSSKLVLECADQKTELLNNNFPESKIFKWNPATCGDVTLSIQFRDIAVEKSYNGKIGFANFLQDFKDGQKIFNVSDFPEQMGYLTNNGVSDIFVSYDINGIEPILKFLNRSPPAIPEIIFKTIKKKSGKYPLVEKKQADSEKKTKTDKKTEPPSRLQELIDQKKTFNITMETLPMEVNESAEVKPVSSIVWMNCNKNIVRIENNNYPITADFEWNPANCGKVLLLIHFPEITLVKEYHHFLEFLEDFNYLSHTFSCNDFPKEKEALLKKSISSIKLTYNFKGELPIMEENDIKTAPEIKLKSMKTETTGKDIEELQ